MPGVMAGWCGVVAGVGRGRARRDGARGWLPRGHPTSRPPLHRPRRAPHRAACPHRRAVQLHRQGGGGARRACRAAHTGRGLLARGARTALPPTLCTSSPTAAHPQAVRQLAARMLRMSAVAVVQPGVWRLVQDGVVAPRAGGMAVMVSVPRLPAETRLVGAALLPGLARCARATQERVCGLQGQHTLDVGEQPHRLADRHRRAALWRATPGADAQWCVCATRDSRSALCVYVAGERAVCDSASSCCAAPGGDRPCLIPWPFGWRGWRPRWECRSR